MKYEEILAYILCFMGHKHLPSCFDLNKQCCTHVALKLTWVHHIPVDAIVLGDCSRICAKEQKRKGETERNCS